MLLDEFKEAEKLDYHGAKNLCLKEGIAGLISEKNDWSFTVDPNTAAKKVLKKVFGVNRLELNRIISKKNEALLLNKLESLKAMFPEFK